MKFFFLFLLACTLHSLSALPLGNPREASFLSEGIVWEGGYPFCVRTGFYGDYVYNRHLKVVDIEGSDHEIEHSQISTNAGYLVANFFECIDVFATFGASNLCLETNFSTFDPSIPGAPRVVAEASPAFSWSVGGRATVWECGDTSVGFEGQYFHMNPTIERVTVASAFSFYGRQPSKYSEWQLGLGLAHRIYCFIPYLGVKWSRVQWKVVDEVHFRNNKSWAYAVGCSLIDSERTALTIEGSFAGEKAVYVNGQLRF